MPDHHNTTVKQASGIILAVLVAITGIIGSFGTSYALLKTERQDTVQQLQRAVDQRNTALQASVDKMLESVRSIPGLFEASDEVNRDEFRIFTDPVLHRHPQIKALFWAPRVASDTHEPAESRDTDGSFSSEPVKTVPDEHAAGSNDQHADYYPIVQVNSFEGAYYSLLGMDLNTMVATPGFLDSVREGAIVKMCNRLCAGEAYFKVKDSSYDFILPAYEGGRSYKTPEKRSLHFTGFVIARFDIDLLVAQALLNYDRSLPGLDFYIYADSSTNDAKRIHYHPSRTRKKSVVPESVDDLLAGSNVITKIRYSDSSWTVLYKPAPGYFEWRPSLLLWSVLITGLLLTVFFTSYILFITNQRQLIRRKVDERTIALNQANAFLDSIIDNLPIMIFVKDVEELRFVRINKAAEDIMGYSKSEMLGKNDFDFFPREQAEFFTNKDLEVLTNGELVDIPEEEIQTAHLGMRTLHTIKVPVLNDEGVPQYLLGISEDITERKQNELELQDSNERIRSVVESVADGIITIDSHGIIQSFNPAASGLFDYPAEEVIGKNVNMLMPEPDHSRHDQYLKNYLKTGQAKIIGTSREVMGRRKDGSLFPLELRVSEMQIQGQSNFTGIVRDITERKQAVQALVEAKQEAEEANVAKSKFLANMSHELRTPLNAIIGYSEMLAEDAVERNDQQSITDLQKIHSSGNHLLELINDILDLSKIEAGRMEISPEAFQVKPLVEEVVNTVQPLIEKNNNVLKVDCAENIGDIVSDSTKLRQVLFNMISNAAKFTQDGEITLTVTRKGKGDKAFVEFTVRDTGIGISEQHLSRLFQPFMQADDLITQKYGGTGLGLSISQRFCELLGGGITVESQLKKGTMFTIKLPARLSAAMLAKTQTATTKVIETSAVTDELPTVTTESVAGTVLVIDDEQEARDLLRAHLEKAGWNVVFAADGQTGLKLAREIQPCAITLDVLMPGLDGWSVLEVLKADPTLSKIPVVMCTILDEKQRGFALGATDYLVKPVARDRLVTALTKYCHNRQCHLLVVEDDAATRELYVRTARQLGWSVVEAINGKEGLQSIEVQRPDLVLLDLMMPEIDGFGVVEALQQREDWRDIPVIVVTAKDLTPEDHQRLNGYVEGLLEKSQYSTEELLLEVTQRLSSTLKE